MQNNASIINKIEELEKQLSALKIELRTDDDQNKKTGRLEKGEQAVILNPNPNQGQRGTLIKVNHVTRCGTVDTVNTLGDRKK